MLEPFTINVDMAGTTEGGATSVGVAVRVQRIQSVLVGRYNGLSVRARNSIRRATHCYGPQTADELARWDTERWEEVPYCGPRTTEEIMRYLAGA